MKDLGKRIELHSHSFFSDGELLPSELRRRAEALNYERIFITDHADSSNLESVVSKIARVAKEFEKHSVRVSCGVELTHIQPETIRKLAREARRLGAELVIVHGETIVEPVPPNTNRTALECGEVNVLAHPGLITIEDCELARENDVYLELSARTGHCLTNGHVAQCALKAGAKLIVCTDLHGPSDFITQTHAYEIALGSGLSEDQALKAVRDNPRSLVRKLST
ncbi:MAG: histidinol phosphate phosphatase domain-containing protein [Candidatus Bathyarchaeia archaeon]